MQDSYSIEKSILVSILEHDFICNDDAIMQVTLNDAVFTHPIHKLFIKAINRLKELNEPINSDFLRERFVQGGRWDILGHEVQLLEIMSHTPLATLYLFKSYLKLLEDNYMMSRIAV